MAITRRDFLGTGMSASVAAGLSAGVLATPRWLPALTRPAVPQPLEAPPIRDPAVRELALRAVEAARAAGATYADVRLTHTRELLFKTGIGFDRVLASEAAWLDTGVRVLVDGIWGFAASAVWTPDEAARLGREAVHHAKASGRGKQRVLELGQIPVIQDGDWIQPVERDPFAVPDGEIRDYMRSLVLYVDHKVRVWDRTARGGRGKLVQGDVKSFDVMFQRQDKAFASSEGSYATQRLYQTRGVYNVGIKGGAFLPSSLITGASRGWEYIRQAPLREEAHRLFEEQLEDMALPIKPVEVGRYDIVFDAWSMAELLDKTLGAATELDRALGYEANAGGTSYLNDPFGMLGSYQAGAPLLSVTADRTTPGGLATVKWDDDGVAPDQFPLVKDGVLVDFQTHREAAAGWFPATSGSARRSHGCAAAPRAYEAPLLHTPNLTLTPGTEARDFDGLISGMKNGIAVKRFTNIQMDWQCLNGFGRGDQFEVQNGKRVARLAGAEFHLRAPEFWKNLLALGGSASQRPFARGRSKGEPAQETWHTVRTVPALVKQVTTIQKPK